MLLSKVKFCRAIGVICLLFCSAVTSAQDAVEWTSAEANLRDKLSKMRTFEATFSQQVVDAQGEVLQNSIGNLVLKQPNLMFWQVTEPDETLLIADGETLWHVDTFVEQVVAMEQSGAVANNPVILLTDMDGQSWQQFQVSQQQDSFEIQAKDPQSQIVSLTLVFSEQRLQQIVFTDRQQQKSTLTFSDVKQNQPLSSERFVFVMPQGYELDDQR